MVFGRSLISGLLTNMFRNSNYTKFVGLSFIWLLNFFIANHILISVIFGVLGSYFISYSLATLLGALAILKSIKNRLLSGMYHSHTITKLGRILKILLKDAFSSNSMIE